MKTVTTLIAAALVAGSATLALAQTGGSGGAAGSDVSVPRQNMQRPTPNSPPVNRRGDDMAPMQGANVSSQTTFSGKKSKMKSKDQMAR